MQKAVEKNKSVICIECDPSTEMSRFCMTLVDHDDLRPQRFLALLGDDDAEEQFLEQLPKCQRPECRRRVIERFFSYLSLVRTLPAVQQKINSFTFPIDVLEGYIYFLLRMSGDETSDSKSQILSYDLSFLSQNKLVQLITESERISKDRDFVIVLFSMLENRSIDSLLQKADDFKEMLTDIFLHSSEDRVREILTRNPLIYNYILLFLELDGRMEESRQFSELYSPIIEKSDQVDRVVREVQKIQSDFAGDTNDVRGKRVGAIVSEILQTEDRDHTFQLLQRHKAFFDEKEAEVVRLLITDTKMQDFLNIS